MVVVRSHNIPHNFDRIEPLRPAENPGGAVVELRIGTSLLRRPS
jgi:hypothetical protein